MPIKILSIINSLEIGGAESFLMNFALESKRNEDIDLEICTLYPSTFLRNKIQKLNIPLWEFNLNFKYNLIGIFKIINLIKKRKYDIIHIHLFPAALFSSIASFFIPQKIKLVFTEHSVNNRRRSFAIFKLLDLFVYSRYSKIICVNRQVQLSLIRWLPKIKKKTDVIFNGVPEPKLENLQFSKKYDVIFIGRLEKVKGINFLLKAVNILKIKQNKNIKLAIVGDGSLKKQLEETAKRLKINDSIKFLGSRQDISNLMISSKILILPSIWEGLPMTILEAMYLKIPIIATSVGGIPEIIENKKDGLLIPSKNPEIIAKTIIYLLENKDLQTKLTQNAYKKVKSLYSIQNYTKNILDIYKELIEF